MATTTGNPPSHRNVPRFFARTILLVWAGFWTWFVTMVMTSEPPAVEPVIALAILWATTALAWFFPRFGGLVLVALSTFWLWRFGNDAALWLIALPAWTAAALAFLGAPPAVSRGAPGGAGCA